MNLAENLLLSGTAKRLLLLPAEELCGSTGGADFVWDSSVSSCLADLIGVARLSFFRSSCYNRINVIQGCLLNVVMNANLKTLYHCKLK